MASNPSLRSFDVAPGKTAPAPAISDDITLSDSPTKADVMSKFRAWFRAAQTIDLKEPASVVISSVDDSGAPNARVLLCRGICDDGITVYTNLQSPGGKELLAHPVAAATFHWMPLVRQVRMRGTTHVVGDGIADAYWHQRSRLSQLHAAVSDQSERLESRTAFEEKVQALQSELDGAPVPRPRHWTGVMLTPTSVEFWTEGSDRFHHRELCTCDDDGSWHRQWLAP